MCVCVCVCAHAWERERERERERACVVTAWSMRMPCWKTYAESNNICLKPLRLFTCTLTPSVLVPLLALMQTHQVNQKCFVFIGLLRWQADYQPDSSTCQRCMKILYWQSPMLPIMRDSDSCWANDGPYTHPNTPLQALTEQHNTYALAPVFIYSGLRTVSKNSCKMHKKNSIILKMI